MQPRLCRDCVTGTSVIDRGLLTMPHRRACALQRFAWGAGWLHRSNAREWNLILCLLSAGRCYDDHVGKIGACVLGAPCRCHGPSVKWNDREGGEAGRLKPPGGGQERAHLFCPSVLRFAHQVGHRARHRMHRRVERVVRRPRGTCLGVSGWLSFLVLAGAREMY